jgi:hypothetical protein
MSKTPSGLGRRICASRKERKDGPIGEFVERGASPSWSLIQVLNHKARSSATIDALLSSRPNNGVSRPLSPLFRICGLLHARKRYVSRSAVDCKCRWCGEVTSPWEDGQLGSWRREGSALTTC